MLLLMMLNTALADDDPLRSRVTGSELRQDWFRDYRVRFGIKGGVALPVIGSGRAWSSAGSWGVVGELALRPEGLSWLTQIETSRHALVRSERYLEDTFEDSTAALSGTAVHVFPQGGIRYEIQQSSNPNVAVTPWFAGLIGADLVTTTLDFPTVEGRTRLTSRAPQPALSPAFGILLKTSDLVHVSLGAQYTTLFGFDSAEVSGTDRLWVTGRLHTTLDVLARF